MAEGQYLSGFIENFLRSRGLEEQRSRAEAQEAGDIFKTERYLEDLGRERKAESTIAQALRRQGAPPPAGGFPGAPPSWREGPSPYEGPPNPEAPPIPSLAAGGAAAMQHGAATFGVAPPGGMAMPQRPPVLESVLHGIAPEAAARLFTTQAGRAALPSLQEAERERRKEEDHKEADELLAKGLAAYKRGEPVEAAGLMAAAYGRVGLMDRRIALLERVGKTLSDKDEGRKAVEDAAALNAAINHDEIEQSPESAAAVQDVVAKPKSLLSVPIFLDFVKAKLSKTLDKDRDIDRFLRHTWSRTVGPNAVSIEEAWKEAMERYPAGLSKLWMQDFMRPGDSKLPEFFWRLLKMEPRAPSKDPTIGQRAWVAAVPKAREAGIPIDKNDPRFNRLLEDERSRLTKQEAIDKRSPTEEQLGQTRLDIARLRLEAMKNPESLAKKTSAELTLLIQRTSSDLVKGDMTPEEERDTKEYLAILRKYRDAKAKGESPGDGEKPSVGPMPPAIRYKGQTIRHPETGQRFQSDGTRWLPVR